MKVIQGIKISSPGGYKLNHEIKENDEKFIVTVKIELDKNKFGNEVVRKCFEEQLSPVTQILGKKEKENIKGIKKGESVIPLYRREKEDD